MKIQVLSYGGGVQTVALIALILKGKLPRPDIIVMADTGREKTSTWDYLGEIVQPALQREGMQVEIASHSLATVDTGWYVRTFPLYDMGLTRADCKVIAQDYGWHIPPSSACWMCPNMDDHEWAEMRTNYPADFARAVEIETELREWDGEIYLHSSRQPLAKAVLNPDKYSRKEGRHQCSMFCMI